MANIRLQLTPESKKLIQNLSKAGKVDLRPALTVIGIGYRKEVNAIFAKKQPRQSGLRWKELSPDYAKAKEKQIPGVPLLVRTGRLKESMISKGAEGNITLIGKTQAVFGSTVPYGIFHDEGTSKMPKRNFSEPSDRRLKIFKNNIEDHIIRTLEHQGITVKKGLFV